MLLTFKRTPTEEECFPSRNEAVLYPSDGREPTRRAKISAKLKLIPDPEDDTAVLNMLQFVIISLLLLLSVAIRTSKSQGVP